jgi:phosphoglycerate kinase
MEYIKKLHSIPNLESLQGKLREKKVFLRADFNVPIHEGKITDTYRIDTTMQTFAFLQQEKAITIVVSHIETKDVESPTLIPVFLYLTEKYPQFVVYFCDNFLQKQDVQICLDAAKEGEFILFENIRRADRTGMSEKLNDAKFAEYVKEFADYYIQDAFAVAHRKHASVSALPKLFDMDHKVAGFQLYKEIHSLSDALQPQKPFVVILSGAKFGTKLPLIEKYLQTADKVFVGGALYNNVLKSLGYEVGVSLVDTDAVYVDTLVQTDVFKEKVYIPKFVIVQNSIDGTIRESHIDNVQKHETIMDIAPQSIIDFVKTIQDIDAKTILWNGPVGNFEVKEFAKGTETLAKELLSYMESIVLQDVKLIVGGGDTVSALNGIENLSHNPAVFMSTGGGAMLEFLEKDGQIPGIMSLID